MMNASKMVTRQACLGGILAFAVLAAAVAWQWRSVAAEQPKAHAKSHFDDFRVSDLGR